MKPEQELSINKGIGFAERYRSEFLRNLSKIIAYPSVSAQHIGQEECVEELCRMMNGLGIKTKLFRFGGGAPIVFATMEGRKPKLARTLILYNHYDVQPVDPVDEWNTDPFKLSTVGKHLFGRGTADDKGDLVARLSAVRSIVETEGTLVPNLCWIIEGEEEIGSPHLRAFVEKYRAKIIGDGCLWEGGHISDNNTPEVTLGVKGLLYVEFQVEVGTKDQHSMYGPIVPNPAWRLVDLLNTIRDKNGKILIKDFCKDALTATPSEVQLLSQNQFSSEELMRDLGVNHLISGKDDRQTMIKLLYSPSCNIAGFNSGYSGTGSKTIIPRKAILKMDFRLPANMRAKLQLERLRKHLKNEGFSDVTLTVHSMQDPAKTSVESHICRILIACGEYVYNRKPNIWPTSAATGPLSIFSNTLRMDTAMGAGMASTRSNPHAPNENVGINHFMGAIKQLICLLTIF